MNINEPPSLLRNDVSGENHWLKVLLLGSSSNRSAIGATVVASYGGRKQAQAVLAQSSYLSVNDRRLHFGLGKAATADIEIRWPNGKQEKIANIAADQLVVIREGSGIVRTDRFSKLVSTGARLDVVNHFLTGRDHQLGSTANSSQELPYRAGVAIDPAVSPLALFKETVSLIPEGARFATATMPPNSDSIR